MKPHPRWEVRVYCRSFFREHVHWVIGGKVVDTTELLSARTYRWRWLASLTWFVHSTTPSFCGTVYWAEMRRASPKLRAVPVNHNPPPSVGSAADAIRAATTKGAIHHNGRT